MIPICFCYLYYTQKAVKFNVESYSLYVILIISQIIFMRSKQALRPCMMSFYSLLKRQIEIITLLFSNLCKYSGAMSIHLLTFLPPAASHASVSFKIIHLQYNLHMESTELRLEYIIYVLFYVELIIQQTVSCLIILHICCVYLNNTYNGTQYCSNIDENITNFFVLPIRTNADNDKYNTQNQKKQIP